MTDRLPEFRARRQRHRDAGLCINCMRPADKDRVHCRQCRDRNAEYRAVLGVYRCGRCGAVGHNRQRCEEGR